MSICTNSTELKKIRTASCCHSYELIEIIKVSIMNVDTALLPSVFLVAFPLCVVVLVVIVASSLRFTEASTEEDGVVLAEEEEEEEEEEDVSKDKDPVCSS